MLGLILFLTCSGAAQAEWKAKGDLDIYMFPVRYGDALLIELPNGNLWLIDGGKSSQDGKDIKNFLLANCAVNGKVAIDAWIITHFDDDHYYGVLKTIESSAIHVNRIFHNGVAKYTGSKVGPFNLTLDQLLELANSQDPATGRKFASHFWSFIKCAQSEGLQAFSKLDTADYNELSDSATEGNPQGLDIEVTVYNPQEDFREYGDSGKTTNGNSIIILLTVGDYDVLLPGDINEEGETYLLNETGFPLDELKGVDLLKFPHHGSKYHLEEFILGLMPIEVWFSPGTQDVRFPDPDWKTLLEANGVEIHDTRSEGGLYREVVFTK